MSRCSLACCRTLWCFNRLCVVARRVSGGTRTEMDFRHPCGSRAGLQASVFVSSGAKRVLRFAAAWLRLSWNAETKVIPRFRFRVVSAFSPRLFIAFGFRPPQLAVRPASWVPLPAARFHPPPVLSGLMQLNHHGRERLAARLSPIHAIEAERLDPKPLYVSATGPKRVEVNPFHRPVDSLSRLERCSITSSRLRSAFISYPSDDRSLHVCPFAHD
jgi:hypothetical protein